MVSCAFNHLGKRLRKFLRRVEDLKIIGAFKTRGVFLFHIHSEFVAHFQHVVVGRVVGCSDKVYIVLFISQNLIVDLFFG